MYGNYVNRCKRYSEITVESGTQLKTVYICSVVRWCMKNIFTKSDHDPTLNFQQDNALKIEQLPVKRCSKIEQNSCVVDFTNSDWILKQLLNSTQQGVSARDYRKVASKLMRVTNQKINFLSKIPFISNLKRPTCASKQDGLALATIQ